MLKRRIFYLVIAIVFSSATLHAAGFEPGASVRAMDKNGNVIEGIIVNYEVGPEISCLDKAGSYFKPSLKEIRRISPVPGQTYMTGGGTKLQVLNLETVGGQSVPCGLSSHGIVKIDQGIKGKRNLWVTETSYKFAEVVDQVQAGSGGQMKVRLMDGRIISVPVRKDEVHSIIFE